jgi:hypothetical protein
MAVCPGKGVYSAAWNGDGVSPMKTRVLVALLALGITSLVAGEGQAAENAAGIYLLGTKTTMAGFVPPPGTYFIDVNYFYAGDASGEAAIGVTLRRLGNLFPNLPPRTLNIQAHVKLNGDAEVALPSFCGSRRARFLAAMSASAPSFRWVERPSMPISMFSLPLPFDAMKLQIAGRAAD